MHPDRSTRPHETSAGPPSLANSATSVSTGAASRRLARLDGWTRHRTIRAEHAAIARFRPQKLAATRAVVEELTAVGRHDLNLRGAAVRAGYRRFEDHRHPLTHTCIQARPGPCRGTGSP